MERALAEANEANAARVAEITASRDEAMRRVAEHKRAARAANALAVSVERKLRAIEADAPERERFEKCITETRARNARRRRRAPPPTPTREEHALSTREEVAARASLEKALFGARESLGTARLETEAVRFELTKWQAAVHEARRRPRRDVGDAPGRRGGARGVAGGRAGGAARRRRRRGARARRVEAEKARGIRSSVGRRVANSRERPRFARTRRFRERRRRVHGDAPRVSGETRTRRQPRPGLDGPGSRAVASAPSPLRRAASHAPPRDRTESVSIEKSGDALAAFTRTAPREGW